MMRRSYEKTVTESVSSAIPVCLRRANSTLLDLDRLHCPKQLNSGVTVPGEYHTTVSQHKLVTDADVE